VAASGAPKNREDPEMNRRLNTVTAVFLALVVGLALQACSKQEIGSGDPEIAGAYTLVSVDGNEMPASVSHGGAAMKVLSGTFVINADGTCSSKTVFVPPTGTETEREVDATYTREGSKLTMKWEGAGMTVGTVEGDTFTMDNDGMVFVFKK
jgi:hypothetical protein